jgi:CHAD domain-containing protein
MQTPNPGQTQSASPLRQSLGALIELDGNGAGQPSMPYRKAGWVQAPSRPVVKRIISPPGPKLAEVLDARWDAYCQEFRRCLKHCSEEAVHELRVSIRRLLTQLILVEEILPGTALSKLRKALKSRFKEFGALRDLHVQRQTIGRLLARHPALVLLDAGLRRREKRLVKDAARSLKSAREKKLSNWIGRVRNNLLEEAADELTQRQMLARIKDATTAAFDEVIKRLSVATISEPETIHRVRLAYKKFRYMVEALSPTWTGYSRMQLRRMAYYQRRLGRIQDLEVLRSTLLDFAEENHASRAAFRPVSKLIDRRRREALRAFLKGADEVRSFWPPKAM